MIARLDRPLNRTAILLLVLASAALALDAWQRAAQRGGRATWLDNAICTAAAPLQSAIRQAGDQAGRSWRLIARSRYLASENERLADRVAELEDRLARLEASYADAAREDALRKAYPDWRKGAQVAQVVGSGTGGWMSYLVLNSGTGNGTRPRDVALSREGVVGQVYAVTAHTARVLSLTDPASGIAVRLQRSRETGVLKGTGKWGCEVRYLSPDADVRVGDKVVTSGSGGVFPKGLPVGVVASVADDPHTPGKVARVHPAAKLGKTEEVLLVRAPSLTP